MVKRIVQLFFLAVGGTLGAMFLPDLFQLLNVSDLPLLHHSYLLALLGAVLFFLLTFWLVDYVVDMIRWVEETLVKAPAVDVLFGSLGLIFGLIIAFFIVMPLQSFRIEVLNTVLPVFLTILLGYLGFRVGWKKRNELMNLFSLSNRMTKKKAQRLRTNRQKVAPSKFWTRASSSMGGLRTFVKPAFWKDRLSSRDLSSKNCSISPIRPTC